MATQPVFGELYPSAAGWKRTDTSQEAAASIDAAGLRARVATWLQANGPATADEAASALGIDRLAIRPRFSELRARHEIYDTGARRGNVSGKRAIVWGVMTVAG